MTAANNLNASLRLFNPGMQGLVSDGRSVDALRSTAARDPKAAVKDAAKQFEALFMQEIMKSMRQASMSSGMLDNAGSQMGTEMLDTQYASMMTGMPRGLSEAIARQLERQMGGAGAAADTPTDVFPGEVAPEFGAISKRLHPLTHNGALDASALAPRTAPNPPVTTPEPAATLGGKLSPVQEKQAEFVKRHTHAANEASAVTGIPASFMVAQAAHESGWGRREIKLPDGSTSFNVFGIKATPGWTGPVAEVTTTEYENGRAHTVKAKFRAYDSYESAFKDYAQMLKNSPRYSQVVASANTAEGFAQGLQRAGYATDPAYADKLTRVINTTLRLQRMVT